MAAPDLCALADVKTWLQIPSGTTTDDALLSALITQVSQWVDSYCNRNLAQATYTEVRDGKGGTRKMIKNYPIQSITTVKIGSVIIPLSPDGIQPGYTWDSNSITLHGYRFDKDQSNVTFVYSGGYPTGQIPSEITLAAIQLVALRYRSRGWIGKTSEAGLSGQSASYYSKDEAPPDILNTLDNYKRRFIGF